VSTARTEEERRADAMIAGGEAIRMKVGDEAKALMLGGRWVEGYWYLVDVAGPREITGLDGDAVRRVTAPTHWITEDGRVVAVDSVQGVWFRQAGRMAEFAEHLGDVHGRRRCELSGEEVAEEFLHEPPNGAAYCPSCESTDVTIRPLIEGGWTYDEHDRRGREYAGAE
jgi:hypothetical protein